MTTTKNTTAGTLAMAPNTGTFSRFVAERKDGTIGFTAWYSDPENLEALKAEILQAGHKIIKTETVVNH